MLIFLIIFIFWLVSAIIDYSEFCYYWQLKEYRLDRFKDFLSTLSGKKFLFSYSVCWRPIILFIFCFLFTIDSRLFSLEPNLLLLILTIDLARGILLFKYKRFKYPKITFKSVVIISISFFIELFLFAFLSWAGLSLLAIACRWLIISSIVMIAKLPTKLIKIIYLKIARKKLLRQKNLLVIGVTGSYGKTTVKNFLEQILSKKFKVIKTPKNINTEIGIAKFIINNKLSDFDIFIVEMGAYRIGEIKIICDMVQPQIGILTAINEQHLQLFGSIKNTQIAKYELLRSLPKSGLAIVNFDNAYCSEFLTELKCNIKTFGQTKNYNLDCLITDIKNSSVGFEFIAIIKNKNGIENYQIKTNLVGAHNVMNIAPVLLTANYLGLTKQEIIEQSAKLKLPEATLEVVNYGKSIIINDSYNSNPQGFLAALKVLDEYQGDWKKIVITRGMLELGKRSQYWHEKIGQAIAQVANELIIISPDSVEPFKKGIGNNKNISVKVELNPKKLLANFQQFRNKKCLILIENQLSQNVYQELIGYT
ncbi:MAG: Mur ligase family protein [Patescibacteria group bacterium]